MPNSQNSPVDPNHLQNVTQELIKAITSPQVIEQMKQFRDKAASGAGHAEAGDLMSLESLKAAGAKLPDDFRITSRVFEDTTTGKKVDLGPAGSSVKTGGQTVSGCAGGGGYGVCGCAGGGGGGVV